MHKSCYYCTEIREVTSKHNLRSYMNIGTYRLVSIFVRTYFVFNISHITLLLKFIFLLFNKQMFPFLPIVSV